MPEDLLWLFATLVVAVLVGHMRYNTTRPKYAPYDADAPATHESLLWPTVFPPWALAMRDGEGVSDD